MVLITKFKFKLYFISNTGQLQTEIELLLPADGLMLVISIYSLTGWKYLVIKFTEGVGVVGAVSGGACLADLLEMS